MVATLVRAPAVSAATATHFTSYFYNHDQPDAAWSLTRVDTHRSSHGSSRPLNDADRLNMESNSSIHFYATLPEAAESAAVEILAVQLEAAEAAAAAAAAGWRRGPGRAETPADAARSRGVRRRLLCELFCFGHLGCRSRC